MEGMSLVTVQITIFPGHVEISSTERITQTDSVPEEGAEEDT
jgi:hypothetical protein